MKRGFGVIVRCRLGVVHLGNWGENHCSISDEEVKTFDI